MNAVTTNQQSWNYGTTADDADTMRIDQPTEQLETRTRRDLPVSPGRMVVLGLCALALGWVVMYRLGHNGRAVFVGVMAAPTTSITVPVDGRLVELSAAERDIVHAGASLVIIEDTQLAAKIAKQTERVNELQAELTAAEARADVDLAWRQKEIEGEIYKTQIEAADLLKQKLTQDVERLAWNDFKTAGASAIQLTSTEKLFLSMHNQEYRSDEEQLRAALKEEAARNAAEVLDAQIELCDQRLAELRQLASRLPNKVKQGAGLNRIRDLLLAAEEDLSNLKLQLQRVTVIAPAYGMVGLFQREVGGDVSRGETVVELFDLDRPFLVARVPSSHLYQFVVDGNVALRFPGDVERTGRVTAIPPQAELHESASDGVTIAVRIEPAGKLWPQVPIGSTVEVRAGE